MILFNRMKKYHVFGDDKEWAISEDDGCLRFHPHFRNSPEKMAVYIWREAFYEVEKLGGVDSVISYLRKEIDTPV